MIKLWNLENGNNNNFEEYERKKYKKGGNNECKLRIVDYWFEQIGNFFRFLEFFLFYITFMKNCFLKIISWKSELSYD